VCSVPARTAASPADSAQALVSAAAPPTQSSVLPTLRGTYFGELGCSHCDLFLYKRKAEIEARYGVALELETYDILKADDYALCARLLEARGERFAYFPVLFIGENAYQGSTAIEANLGPEIEHFLANAAYRPRIAAAAPAGASPLASGGFDARFLPVFLAGLLDGVNPCAFSSLLFFLSYLALRRKSRGEILSVGLVFILSVFAVYFLLGLGLLGGLRAIAGYRWIKTALNAAIAALSVVLGSLSLRDAFRVRAGVPEDAALKLPEALGDMNRRVIRALTGRRAFLAAAALTGVAVSLLELACTGQIYLPTLAYINRTAASGRSLFLLLAYNLAFVAPLLAVFVVFFFGATHARIVSWYRGKLFAVRLGTAFFFFAMAAFIWLS